LSVRGGRPAYDDAIFTEGEPLGAGRLMMRNSAGDYQFNPDPGKKF
jgi:hypothetical protein